MKEHQISLDEYEASAIPTPYDKFINAAPTAEIQAAFIKHYRKIHGYDTFREYDNIVVSVSGGADSDRIVDLIERIGYPKGTVHYVFFNTGMEYKATKDHLKDLEQKYGISIETINPKMPVGAACHKYGLPFLSKQISNYIHRLQRHNFCWEDRPFEELYAEYPKCKSALLWWCNEWGEGKKTNINKRKYLKEFMIAHPPDFPISDMCCQKAKKDPAHSYRDSVGADLSVNGVRKAEGGVRSTAVTSCFTSVSFGCDTLRPLFWFKADDCDQYDQTFDVCHSKCYTLYGLKRTGCACCPFGRCFEQELEAAREHEPALYRAALAIFGNSYEYTRKYKEFVRMKDAEEKDKINEA